MRGDQIGPAGAPDALLLVLERDQEEGRERLRNGMWLLIREASMARNLQALLPLVKEFGTNRIAFCTDDRDPEDIAENGHINGMVREAVAAGIAPEDAIVLASHNPATWHRLWHLGAIAPGYQADLLLLPDLERFEPELTLKSGRPVEEIPQPEVPEWVKHSVRNHPVTEGDLRIPWEGGDARVIGLVPDQIVTELIEEEPGEDHARIAVVERHLGTGRIGRGFVRGSGLQRGALASTVAHDAHNIIVVGMAAAIESTIWSTRSRPAISASSTSRSCGLTAITTRPAPSTASAFEVVAVTA